MAFMEPQIEHGTWYEIDGDSGITFVPADIIGALPIDDGESVNDWSQDPRWDEILPAVRDHYDGSNPREVKLTAGWGARFSAPGYMDCTEWSLFDTEQEALDYLADEADEADEADDE